MASASPSGGGGDSMTQSYYDNTVKFNPTTAVVIIVLIAGCFVLAFVSVVVRRCMRGNVPQPATGPQSTFTAKTRGLQKADVDALPLVHSADLSEKDHDHECPVCLMEFEPEETLRLLPACKHVFHQECIDAWFDSHSTCPLCRASLVGSNGEKTESAVPAGDAVDTIVEVSENGDYSDAEVHGGVAPGTLPQDSLAAVGPVISREDERRSARGPLFRNSESFKRAARGVAAQESADATAEDEKNSSFRKPAATTGSIRRSPSLGADLISLRNLLMRGDQNANATPTDPSSHSSRWFARAQSLELANRDHVVANEYSREPPQSDWVTIDLQSGMVAPEAARISGESSSAGSPEPARSWSDRFSLTRLKSLKGIGSLSRSTSDVSSRHTPQNLPI